MVESRRWLWWAGGAYLGVLLAVLLGMLVLYQGARQRLDQALGLRLQGVATTAVHLVDGDAMAGWSLDPEPADDLLWLTTRLQRVRQENDLAEITLCDQDGFIVASSSQRVPRGDLNVFWDLDLAAVTQTKQGFSAVSRLYRKGALYQKSAHAPVRDSLGKVTGVLTVEGNADFFDVLATLRRGTMAIVAAVMVFLGLMGWLLARIYRSLEHARRELADREQLAAMGRMTAGIAHEIRNPLGIIRGAGQHLQRVLADRGIEDEVAGYIPEEVDRLDALLTGYLEFGSDRESDFEEVPLVPLVTRTVKLVREELTGTGVTVAVEPAAEDLRCQGDPRRLQQLMLNLLLNARDAMPDGGTVTVTLDHDQGGNRVRVMDAGHGLGDSDPEKLFEPFHTTRARGSGLGLAISRRIAREHGGDLTLTGRADGAGCVAVLVLPVAADRQPSTGSNHG